MKVTFYGTRGSIPSPGAEFVKYGGNTACTYVELDDGTGIILDAGTGIKKLGERLAGEQGDIHILLSHNHWDHIQGFPFFVPIYQPNRNIYITPGQVTFTNEEDFILKQMTSSYFPVCYTSLQSNIEIVRHDESVTSWKLGSAMITRNRMNHPGCGSSYVIEADGKKLAYVTDNELNPPYQKNNEFYQWADVVRGADLLIHDAQYVSADMPLKAGWGHSLAEEAVKLAMGSNVKQLALYSHDPSRTDDLIDEIDGACQNLLELMQAKLICFPAKEGQVVEL